MIKAAGARLWHLPPYSPDFNPVEQAFAKIKHWMRSAQKRTIEDTWRYIGSLLATSQPSECAAEDAHDATHFAISQQISLINRCDQFATDCTLQRL